MNEPARITNLSTKRTAKQMADEMAAVRRAVLAGDLSVDRASVVVASTRAEVLLRKHSLHTLELAAHKPTKAMIEFASDDD